MTTELVPRQPISARLPAIIAGAGESAARRFLEYFTANIRNKNTRMAYARAVGEFFAWCDRRGLSDFQSSEPMVTAAYVEEHARSIRRIHRYLRFHTAKPVMLSKYLRHGESLRDGL